MGMQILITTASLLFFSNKTLVLLGHSINKRIGWFFGALGAGLFIFYFFLIEAYILSIVEIGLTILMTYRFLVAEKTNKYIEVALGVVTGIFISILTFFTSQGVMTIAQFLGASGMLIGTYLLISVNQQSTSLLWKERIGFLLYGFGHLCTSYIGYQKHEWIFFIFQAWQMFLCFVGFAMTTKKSRVWATYFVLVAGSVSALLFSIVIINTY